MKEYTVKEFAELAKVTPQAIYKQIWNAESLIQQFVVKRDGKTYIQDSALQALYGVEKPVAKPEKEVEQPGLNGSATKETEFNNQLNNVEQPSTPGQARIVTGESPDKRGQACAGAGGCLPDVYTKDYIASLNAQIDFLKRQIEEKDAHIIELTSLASKALNTTSQQQYLTAASSGLQLDEQPVDRPIEQPTVEFEQPAVEHVDKPGKKRSLFHRLFFND